MCGILYIHDPHRNLTGLEMAYKVFLGLSNLQHRGQHGGGIAGVTKKYIWSNKFFGLVNRFYDPHSARLKPPRPFRGELGELVRHAPYKVLAQLRYATAGPDDDLVHYQPHNVSLQEGRVFYAANGDIPNLTEETERLERLGTEFESENDAELTLKKISYLKAHNGCTWVEAIQEFMATTPGAYSGILMSRKKTFFIRDPWGFRPFLVGQCPDGTIVAASESCVFDILGAQFVCEVQRGEVIEIDDDGNMIHYAPRMVLPAFASHCVFCLDYFARPDSRLFIDEREFSAVRQKGSYAYTFGRELARERLVDADFVASVPNSGDLACRGYHIESGIPERQLFIRNFAIPRTFIMSDQEEREFLVSLKYGLMTDMIKKYPHVCLVDDSLVRGTTSRGLGDIAREAGAKSVHMRFSFPAITHPCFMGIAMPTKKELVASSRSMEEIRTFLKVDSIGYLSYEGLRRALEHRGDDIRNFCTACFTGNYPIPVPPLS
jgi:amidophosphoribosyltransferase